MVPLPSAGRVWTGRTQICLYPIDPKRISAGLYEIARAVALDPTLGGTAGAKVTESVPQEHHIQYHGTDEGMQQLKEIARTSPVSPDGYRIEAAGDGVSDEESRKIDPSLGLQQKHQENADR